MEFGIRVNDWSISLAVLPQDILLGIWWGNYYTDTFGNSKDLHFGAIFLGIVIRKYEKTH